MKLLFMALGLLMTTAALACNDFSGTYMSSNANPSSMGKRIYKITQNGCDLKIELNNGGTNVDPDFIRADNLAYDRSTGNFDHNGHVINPFLPASNYSIRFVRTNLTSGTLRISELYSWKGQLNQCKEDFVLQKDCSYTQHAFTKNGSDLTETFNGYVYSQGQHKPYSIYYNKVN